MKRTIVATVVGLAVCLGSAVAFAQPVDCNRRNLVVVLDKSSSMNGPLDPQTSGPSKYSVAKTAVETLLNLYSQEINIGFSAYPGTGGCTPGTVKIAPGLETADEIKKELDTAPPTTGDFSPIYKTLQNVRGYLKGNFSGETTYVMLVTDGFESTYPECGWETNDPNVIDGELKKLIGEMAAEKIVVFIVGFGNSVNTYGLTQMSIAAGTKLEGCNPNNIYPWEPNSCYFKADDSDKLVSALKAIAIEVQFEICDGFDNDCDGKIDEGLGELTCGKGVCAKTIPACKDGKDQVCDPMEGASKEICDNLDNDCDGVVDEFDEECSTACGTKGTRHCSAGKWTACSAVCETTPDASDGDDAQSGDHDGDLGNDATEPGEDSSDNGSMDTNDNDGVNPDDDVTEDTGENDPDYSYKDVVKFHGDVSSNSSKKSKGCGCTIENQGPDAGPAAALLLLLVGLLAYRRRQLD